MDDIRKDSSMEGSRRTSDRGASRPMTDAADGYFSEARALRDLLITVAESAQRRDHMVAALAEVVVTISDRHDPQTAQKLLDEGAGAVRGLRVFGPLLLQTYCARSVDNFLTYVSELIGLIFTTRPETMRSREQVRLDEVLKHDSMQDLVESLAERQVERLSREGMKQLTVWISQNLGLELFETQEALDRAVRLHEVRNLITHNRGIVNRRVRHVTGEAGHPVLLTGRGVFDDIYFMADAVASVDQRAIEKFGLPAPHRKQSLTRVRGLRAAITTIFDSS